MNRHRLVAVYLGHAGAIGTALPRFQLRREEKEIMQRVTKVTSIFRHLILAGLVLGTSMAWAAGPRKLSGELASVSKGQWVKVIVQYRVPTDRDFAQARTMAKSGAPTRTLSSINSVSLTVKSDSLSSFENNANVAHVSLDHQLFETSTTTDFYDQAVNAPYAWSAGLDGSGIGIAIIDSGITDQGDFSGANGSRVVYSGNFNNDGINNAFGHGTHVAGILAGNGANSTGSGYTKTFRGIAPNANLLSFRVLDGVGVGTDSDVIAAIQAAISMKATYNIRVMNISLGRPVFESYTVDPLCQAVEAAWKAGIVVVVAAGNDGRDNSFNTTGYGTITAPGNDPYVITVGAMKPEGTATRADDLIASYSSKGPTAVDHIVKPDLVAPGNLTISTLASTSAAIYTLFPQDQLPMSYYSTTDGSALSSEYFILSGTSMAAPVVSGAAALLLQQNSSLTPDQVKARLMKTAYKIFPKTSTAVDPVTGIKYMSYYDIFTVGAGYVDIQAALSNRDVASSTIGAARSPAVARDRSGNVYVVTNSSVVWGNSVVWATSVVWGNVVIWGTANGNSVLAGSAVVWGTATLNGYCVVWGTSAPTPSSAAAADDATVTYYGEK
jgi:serine protease AprX